MYKNNCVILGTLKMSMNSGIQVKFYNTINAKTQGRHLLIHILLLLSTGSYTIYRLTVADEYMIYIALMC